MADLLGLFSPVQATRESAAAGVARESGVTNEQIAIAQTVASRKAQGASDAQIAAELAARTAKAAGASDTESSTIGAFAVASTARPHTQHPCPIADRWFDASVQLGKSYNVPLPSAAQWDKYTCREKNQIMATTQLGQGVLGPGAAAAGYALVEVERASGDVVDAAKKTVAKVFHF